MTQESFNVDELDFNSKNFVGWIRLFLDLDLFDYKLKDKMIKYVSRTDVVRRRKELEDVFGW